MEQQAYKFKSDVNYVKPELGDDLTRTDVKSETQNLNVEEHALSSPVNVALDDIKMEECDDYPIITAEILECNIKCEDGEEDIYGNNPGTSGYELGSQEDDGTKESSSLSSSSCYSLLSTLLAVSKYKERADIPLDLESEENLELENPDITLSEFDSRTEFVFHDPKKNIPDKYKRFRCDLCPYSSDLKSNLFRHTKSHSNDRPFGCLYCEYRSITKQHLTRHMTIHTNEFPYECQFCEYKTREKNKLTIHMMKHTNDFPHKCMVCKYKTRWKNNLTNHMAIHTGNYRFRCALCDYKTRWKNALKYHMTKHTGEARSSGTVSGPVKHYKCDYCSYNCNIKSNYVRHIKNHIAKFTKVAKNLTSFPSEGARPNVSEDSGGSARLINERDDKIEPH